MNKLAKWQVDKWNSAFFKLFFDTDGVAEKALK
jgi:hypothetical protein